MLSIFCPELSSSLSSSFIFYLSYIVVFIEAFMCSKSARLFYEWTYFRGLFFVSSHSEFRCLSHLFCLFLFIGIKSSIRESQTFIASRRDTYASTLIICMSFGILNWPLRSYWPKWTFRYWTDVNNVLRDTSFAWQNLSSDRNISLSRLENPRNLLGSLASNIWSDQHLWFLFCL